MLALTSKQQNTAKSMLGGGVGSAVPFHLLMNNANNSGAAISNFKILQFSFPQDHLYDVLVSGKVQLGRSSRVTRSRPQGGQC